MDGDRSDQSLVLIKQSFRMISGLFLTRIAHTVENMNSALDNVQDLKEICTVCGVFGASVLRKRKCVGSGGR